MRHTYLCPLRWSDVDLLGHVNNVRYIDYLQEARTDFLATRGTGLFADADPSHGLVVVRHQVDFVRPLLPRDEPVTVDVWVSGLTAATFTFGYEIYDETPEGRVTYVRASSLMAPVRLAEGAPRRLAHDERAMLQAHLVDEAPRRALPRDGSTRHVLPLRVRWSDLDPYRHVNNVMYFDYFQEARIKYLLGLRPADDTWGSWVVARTDVEHRRQMEFRTDPYQVHSWVSHVGNSSFTISSEIRDDENVYATGVVAMVSFDTATQRAAVMTDQIREMLRAEMHADRDAG